MDVLIPLEKGPCEGAESGRKYFGQICGVSLVKLSNFTLLDSNGRLSVERTGGVSVSLTSHRVSIAVVCCIKTFPDAFMACLVCVQINDAHIVSSYIWK